MPHPKKKLTHHVSGRILVQLKIFAVVFLGMFAFVLYDLYIGSITILLVLIALIIGNIVGIISSRMSHLSYDHDSKKIISQFDKLGIAILILYILSAVFRNKIIGIFIHGPMLGAFSFTFIAGTMLGRVIGMRNGIKGILKDEGIIH